MISKILFHLITMTLLFHSKKYNDVANKTKASFCLTTDVLKIELPINCLPLVVDNVLLLLQKLHLYFTQMPQMIILMNCIIN